LGKNAWLIFSLGIFVKMVYTIKYDASKYGAAAKKKCENFSKQLRGECINENDCQLYG
jgi:hypothetical protein